MEFTTSASVVLYKLTIIYFIIVENILNNYGCGFIFGNICFQFNELAFIYLARDKSLLKIWGEGNTIFNFNCLPETLNEIYKPKY